jgi:hypothetical protein
MLEGVINTTELLTYLEKSNVVRNLKKYTYWLQPFFIYPIRACKNTDSTSRKFALNA